MKVIIAGSRTLSSGAETFVNSAINLCPFIEEVELVISGGAQGVDKIGEKWAEANFIPFVVYKADWTTYGKAAGPIRNKQMADVADALIYIRYESTPGTADMIKQMRKQGKITWGVTIAGTTI